jgi:hypothetical protein
MDSKAAGVSSMIKLLSLILLFAGCAVYKTHNQSTTGTVRFPGGVYQDVVWDDSLYFSRSSWYHGMTLYYDALLYRADPASPFSRWFSESEKEFFQKCENMLVSVNYSADPNKISHVMFREQMRLNGYDDIVLNQFASYIKTHPTFQAWNLQNYKISGFCKRQPSRIGDGETIDVSFPNFKIMKLEI